jgi:hypothetical protein
MSRDAERCRWTPSILAVALAASLSCQKEAQQPAPEARPNRQPRFTGSQIMTIPFDSIRAYAERLEFNSRPPAADSAPVDWAGDRIDSIGGKDTSWIEPAVGAYYFDSTELAQGRVVARIWSSKVYLPSGFGPWWSYWWIDENGVDSVTHKRVWRSVFISDSTRTHASRSRFVRGLDPYHAPLPGPLYYCPGYTCARLHKGSVVACYDCGGYWCSTKPH